MHNKQKMFINIPKSLLAYTFSEKFNLHGQQIEANIWRLVSMLFKAQVSLREFL